MRTLREAIAQAYRLADREGEPRYVIAEDGYHVATEDELETYYAGAPVVHCTEDR